MGWVVLLGLLFGAGDQYLGTTHVLVHTGAWTTTLSNMSALWLIVPFLAGWSQPTRNRALVAGLASLGAAFTGYWALTLSPLEGVSTAQAIRGLAPLIDGHLPWLVGGTLGAPLFAILGYRWRTRRAWSSALAVSALLLLEPAAWLTSGLGPRFTDARPAWTGEMAAGLAAALAFAFVRLRRTD